MDGSPLLMVLRRSQSPRAPVAASCHQLNLCGICRVRRGSFHDFTSYEREDGFLHRANYYMLTRRFQEGQESVRRHAKAHHLVHQYVVKESRSDQRCLTGVDNLMHDRGEEFDA